MTTSLSPASTRSIITPAAMPRRLRCDTPLEATLLARRGAQTGSTRGDQLLAPDNDIDPSISLGGGWVSRHREVRQYHSASSPEEPGFNCSAITGRRLPNQADRI